MQKSLPNALVYDLTANDTSPERATRCGENEKDKKLAVSAFEVVFRMARVCFSGGSRVDPNAQRRAPCWIWRAFDAFGYLFYPQNDFRRVARAHLLNE